METRKPYSTDPNDTLWRILQLRLLPAKTGGRNRQPSAASIDSQSVQTTDRGGVKGFDSARCTKGRKRHLLVDTLGLAVTVLVTVANVQDRDGAKRLLAFLRTQCTRLRLLNIT